MTDWDWDSNLLADSSSDCLSSPVLVTLPMPGDLSCLFTVLAEYNPGVVLGQCQVDILQAQNLAGCYHSKRHTGAVQFGTWSKLNKSLLA